MIKLINKSKVSEVLQVAIGYKETDFDKYIIEAQKFDLFELVCEEFFYDLLKNRTDAKYSKLINGSDYTYKGNEYSFDGLASTISYFAYARFILKSNIVSTSHGFTIKKTPHSEPLSLDERRNFYYSYRKDANTVFENVKRFIERNINDYPKFNCESSDCGVSKSKGSFKTTVIK